MIRLRRAYQGAPGDGSHTVLVDRLWPRGVRKEALAPDEWLKDVAPSPELRRWFNHDPARWAQFRQRYRHELSANPAVLEPLRAAAGRGDVTLLFATRDLEHNHAIVLKEYLDQLLAGHEGGNK